MLRGVHAVVQMAEGGGTGRVAWFQPGRGKSICRRKGRHWRGAVAGAVQRRNRLYFGLRLDTIITAVAIWGFWRWCLRRAAMTI